MKITKVVIRNVGAIESYEGSFANDQVILCMGPNGSGKSSFLGALKYGLTGVIPKYHGTKGQLQRQLPGDTPAKPSFVDIEFLSHGVPIRILTHVDSSECRMKIGEAEWIKGATDVNARRAELFGADLGVLASFCIVEQRTLHDLLFTQPATRIANIQKLLGLAELEKHRDRLQKVFGNIQTPDLTNELATAKDYLDRSNTDLEAANTSLTEATHILLGLDVVGASNVLQRKKDTDAAGASISAMHLVMDGKKQFLQQSYEKHEQTIELLSEAASELAALQVDQEKNVNRLTDLRMRKYHDGQRDGLFKQLAALSEPKNPGTYTLPDDIALIEKEAADLEGMINAAKTAQANFSAKRVGKCDTCGAECQCCKQAADAMTDVQIAAKKTEMTNTIKAYTEVYNAKLFYINQHRNQAAVYAAANVRYEQDMVAYKSRRDQINDTIANLPTYTLADQAEEKALDEWAGKCNTVATNVNRLRANMVAEDGTIKAAEAELVVMADSLSQLYNKAQAAPSKEEVLAAEQVLKLHSEYSGRKSQLESTVKALAASNQSFTAHYQTLLARHEKTAKLTLVKSDIVAARDVLHRDKLPMRAAVGFMQKVSNRSNEILPALGAKFSVFVRNQDFWHRKHDGTTLPAKLLSGGEAVRWCLGYLLSVHRMFSNNLGLMLLDEPTDGIDEDGVSDIGAILGTFGSIVANSDTQLFMATHYKSMQSAADRVIEFKDGSIVA